MLIVGYGTMAKRIWLDGKSGSSDDCSLSDRCVKSTIYPISGSIASAMDNDFFLCPPGMQGNILFIPHNFYIKGTNTYLSIRIDICEQRTHNLSNKTGNYSLCRMEYHLECDKRGEISALYDYILICK